MKRIVLAAITLLLFFAGAALCQQFPGVRYFSNVPTGSCVDQMVVIAISDGNFYRCEGETLSMPDAGHWVAIGPTGATFDQSLPSNFYGPIVPSNCSKNVETGLLTCSAAAPVQRVSTLQGVLQ
jgi:hypothetical protein